MPDKYKNELNRDMHELRDFCKYDMTTISIRYCSKCNDGLCSTCGYIYEDVPLCNECYHEIMQRDE